MPFLLTFYNNYTKKLRKSQDFLFKDFIVDSLSEV